MFILRIQPTKVSITGLLGLILFWKGIVSPENLKKKEEEKNCTFSKIWVLAIKERDRHGQKDLKRTMDT